MRVKLCHINIKQEITIYMLEIVICNFIIVWVIRFLFQSVWCKLQKVLRALCSDWQIVILTLSTLWLAECGDDVVVRLHHKQLQEILHIIALLLLFRCSFDDKKDISETLKIVVAEWRVCSKNQQYRTTASEWMAQNWFRELLKLKNLTCNVSLVWFWSLYILAELQTLNCVMPFSQLTKKELSVSADRVK